MTSDGAAGGSIRKIVIAAAHRLRRVDMIRRDWFQQQIEIFARALASALGLKAKGDIRSAIEKTEEAFSKAFGMQGRLALGLPLEQFIPLACRGEKPSAELLAALSKAFHEWAGMLKAEGREAEAASAYRRSEECLAYKGGDSGPGESARR